MAIRSYPRIERRGPALLLTACLWVVSGPTALANEALKAAQAQVDEVSSLMSQLQTTLDLQYIDRDALLDRQDYDPELLIDFVREQIYFEAYEGVLRGAEGALVSRAGNALDQALLLATLLNEAGLEARIVRGRLSEVESKRLVDQLGESRGGDELALLDQSRWEALNQELAALNPGEGARTLPAIDRMPFFRRATTTSDLLLRRLEEAGHPLAPYETTGLVETSQDYFWVELRDRSADPWRPVHPAFRRAAPPEKTPEVLEIFGQSVPESLQHRLRVEVFIEQRSGSTTNAVRVAGPWERPVANLNAEVLSFHNQPNTVNSNVAAGDLESARARANLYIPVLHGTPGTAFDLLGQTVDIDSLSMDRFGASAVIQTVGGKGADAASALQGLGADEAAANQPLMKLTGQWMVFTLITPGGGERRFRRDLLPPDAGSIDDPALRQALSVRHDYLVTGGRFSETFAAAKLYDRFVDAAPAWRQLNTVLFREADRFEDPARLDRSALPFLALVRSFDRGEDFLGLGPSYRPSPTLVILHSGSLGGERAYRGVDIVANERVVLTGGGPVKMDPAANLRLGVWDTAMETLVYPAWLPGDRRSNTFEVFEAAAEQSIDLRLVESAGEIPTNAVTGSFGPSRLAADLEHGRIALLPERTPEGPAMTGWWRVDPKTGDTLGMLADGRGSELAEYVTSNLVMLAGLYLAVGKYAECDQYANADNPEKQACCLIEAHMSNVGGNALGGAIGASFGTTAGTLCEAEGILVGQVQEALGKDEAFRCRAFDNPDAMIGSGGIVNTDYMGCGGLQNVPAK